MKIVTTQVLHPSSSNMKEELNQRLNLVDSQKGIKSVSELDNSVIRTQLM